MDPWRRISPPISPVCKLLPSQPKVLPRKTCPDQNSSIPFLDTLITVSPTGQYETKLYFKPMASPIIIHFTSAQPMHVNLRPGGGSF